MDADDQMVEGALEEVTGKEADRYVEGSELEKDECLETIFCEGDCQNISQLSCKTSTEVWSRGENIQHRDRIITTSSAGEVGRGENVSECVQTVHCPGNCASRLHTTTPEVGRGV